MADSFEELREYLHRSGIGSTDAAPGSRDATATALAGEQALARILARRRHSTRRSIVAIGALGVSALAVAVLLGPPDAAQDEPADATLAALPVDADPRPAASVLEHAALSAQGEGQYSAPGITRAWYTWARDDDRPPAAILTTLEPGEDGTMLVAEQDAGPLDPDGRISGEAAGDDSPSTFAAPAPTDSTLTSILTTPCRYGTVACAFEAVTDLRTNPAPQSVIHDAALWQALAGQKGIAAPGSTTDRLGRPAVVVSADSLDGRHRIALLIDPTTGRYLGTEVMVLDGSTARTVGFVAVA